MSAIWIQDPHTIWLGEGQDADSSRGLVIKDGCIAEHVAAGHEPETPVDEVYDARSLIVIPGLINCHHHFYQTLTRAYPPALDKELFEWLVNLYPTWAHLDERCVELSTKLAMAELMLSGCTTASDHHYLFNEKISSAIDIQVECARDMGMRVVLTRGSMSLGESDGGLPPDIVVQNEEQILLESERLIKRYHQSKPGADIQIALAPCSPFSVTENLMKESAELARKHGVLLHTHLAETDDENRFCIETFGVRPVDYLERVGWMADDVWLAHGIHFTADEVKRLGAAGVAVSHCPSSNMMLASGMAKTLELESRGCPVGLGVDGSASNDCSNMIQEVRQAFLLQRLHYGSENVSHFDALRWATKGGANVLRRSDIGDLDIGTQADIALFGTDEARFSGCHDALAGLVLSGASRVESLMIGGDWKVKDKQLIGVDMEALCRDHTASAVSLARRYQG